MSDLELEPLSERARALLDEERAIRDELPVLRDRVMGRLSATLGPGLGFDTDGSTPHGSGGQSGGAAPAASGGAAGPGFSLAGAKLVGVVATTFAIGAGAGAFLERSVAGHAEAPRVVTTATASATALSVSPSTSIPVVDVTSLPPAPSVGIATAVSSPGGRPSADTRGDLGRERAIIDAAQAGVARGHPEAALEAVGRHERLFPHGQLREEREGIRVLALAFARRTSEARAYAERFRKEFPDSVFIAPIEAALPSP